MSPENLPRVVSANPPSGSRTASTSATPMREPSRSPEASTPTGDATVHQLKENHEAVWRYLFPFLCRYSNRGPAELERGGLDIIEAILSCNETRPLLDVPRKRELGQIGPFSIGNPEDAKLLLIQTNGDEPAVPCSSCYKGSGPFVGCVTLPSFCRTSASGPRVYRKPKANPCVNCRYQGVECFWPREKEISYGKPPPMAPSRPRRGPGRPRKSDPDHAVTTAGTYEQYIGRFGQTGYRTTNQVPPNPGPPPPSQSNMTPMEKYIDRYGQTKYRPINPPSPCPSASPPGPSLPSTPATTHDHHGGQWLIERPQPQHPPLQHPPLQHPTLQHPTLHHPPPLNFPPQTFPPQNFPPQNLPPQNPHPQIHSMPPAVFPEMLPARQHPPSTSHTPSVGQLHVSSPNEPMTPWLPVSMDRQNPGSAAAVWQQKQPNAVVSQLRIHPPSSQPPIQQTPVLTLSSRPSARPSPKFAPVLTPKVLERRSASRTTVRSESVGTQTDGSWNSQTSNVPTGLRGGTSHPMVVQENAIQPRVTRSEAARNRVTQNSGFQDEIDVVEPWEEAPGRIRSTASASIDSTSFSFLSIHFVSFPLKNMYRLSSNSKKAYTRTRSPPPTTILPHIV